jgi:Kef-type K+ transport system membrane component KefB
MADFVLIVGFTLSMQLVRWVTGGQAEAGLMATLAWEMLGSMSFGALLGAAFALYLRLVGREITLVLLALCWVLGEMGSRLHFEAVLSALAAGLVVENIAPPSGDALRDAVERGALPILIVFFAAAGASLDLDALRAIGWVALGVGTVRLLLIRGGTRLGARLGGVDPPLGTLVWTGLISQAGVTLGLTLIVAAEFPPWGATVQTLTLGLIALHQLVGPVLFRNALARAGEIGGLDRAAAASFDGQSAAD